MVLETVVQLHDKRLRIIDARRTESRIFMDEVTAGPSVRPIRYNGLLLDPPAAARRKTGGGGAATKCVTPVMMMREALKADMLLAEVREAAEARMQEIQSKAAVAQRERGGRANTPSSLLSSAVAGGRSRPSTPAAAVSPVLSEQKHDDDGHRHDDTTSPLPRPASSSAFNGRTMPHDSRSKKIAEDPVCNNLVLDIARTVQRTQASQEHTAKVAARKRDIISAARSSGNHKFTTTMSSVPYSLSEADLTAPLEGMGLRIVQPSAASAPKAKLPDASLLRGGSL
jgi:hypothetical protein